MSKIDRSIDSATARDAAVEDSAEAAIRKLMSAQKREVSRQELPPLSAPIPAAEPLPARKPRASALLVEVDRPPAPVRARASTPGPAAAGAQPKARRRLSIPGPRALLARLRAYRPRRKHILLAALALVMVLRPWLVPTILFVAFWAALIGYLTLGPDRVAEMVTGGWDRLRRRRPELAERLRQRADRTANRLDAVLDRLPGKWKEGLYLPDFSEEGTRHDTMDTLPDPFERIAAERAQG